MKTMKLKEKDICLTHFSCRICFLLTGAFLFSILPLIVIKAHEAGIHSGLGWWIGGFLSAIISGYLFCNMFFVEVEKSPKEQKKLKASRMILYVVVLGLQTILGVGCFLSIHYEEILGLYLIIASILWVLVLILAIFNKIQVNVHNPI